MLRTILKELLKGKFMYKIKSIVVSLSLLALLPSVAHADTPTLSNPVQAPATGSTQTTTPNPSGSTPVATPTGSGTSTQPTAQAPGAPNLSNPTTNPAAPTGTDPNATVNPNTNGVPAPNTNTQQPTPPVQTPVTTQPPVVAKAPAGYSGPTLLTVVQNGTSIDLTWKYGKNKLVGTQSIELESSDGSLSGTIYSPKSSLRKLTIKELSLGSKYKVTLLYESKVKLKKKNLTLSKNISLAKLPSKPSLFSLDTSSGKSELSWLYIGTDILYYNIGVSVDGAKEVIYKVSNKNTKFIVDKFSATRSYKFRLWGVNIAGKGLVAETTFANAAPDMPKLTATAVNSVTAKLSWLNTGAPATSYTLNIFSPGNNKDATSVRYDGTILTTTITGLTSNADYKFSLVAQNKSGTTTSILVPISLNFLPGSPRNLKVQPGDKSATLSWQLPVSYGATELKTYQVEYSSDSGSHWTLATYSGTTPNFVLTQLDNGTLYHARVAALNSTGNGPYSSVVSFTPDLTPYTPTKLIAVGGLNNVNLTWENPKGGSPLYTIEYKITNAQAWNTLSTGFSGAAYNVNNLNPATAYSFRITNTAAPVDEKANLAVVNAETAPNSPSNLILTSGISSIQVKWDAPTYNLGATINGYRVEYNYAGNWVTSNELTNQIPYTLAGLSAGYIYQVRVMAVNSFGVLSSASPIVSVAPLPIPGSPTNISLAQIGGLASVGFTPPLNNIDGKYTYRIEHSLDGISWISDADNLTIANASSTKPSNPQFVSAAVSANGGTVSFLPAIRKGTGTFIGYVITPYGQSINVSTTTTGGTSSSSTTLGSVGSCQLSPIIITDAQAAVFGSNPILVSVSNTSTCQFNYAKVKASSTSGYSSEISTQSDPTLDGASQCSSGTIVLPCSVQGLVNGLNYTFRVTTLSSGVLGGNATSSINLIGVPLTPISASASFTSNAINFQWTPPTSDGGSPVIGYKLNYTKDGINWGTYLPGAGICVVDQSVVNYNLINGTSLPTCTLIPNTNNYSIDLTIPAEIALFNPTTGFYTFKLQAVNALGASSMVAVTSNQPIAPQQLTGIVSGTNVNLTWVMPNYSPSVSAFKIFTSADEGATWDVVVGNLTTLSYQITGLTPGITYLVKVISVSSAGGLSQSSIVKAKIASALPGPVLALTAKYGDQSIKLAWQAPSVGSALTSYSVLYKISSNSNYLRIDNISYSSLGYTLGGLSNGQTYDVVVLGVNAAGDGVKTSTTASPGVPASGVLNLLASPNGVQGAVVTWSVPTNLGGAKSLTYRVEFTTDSVQWNTLGVVGGTIAQVNSLNQNLIYTFRVTPIANTLLEGTPVTATMAQAVYGWNLSAVNGSTPDQVDLTWSKPGDANSPINAYLVEYSTNNGVNYVTAAGYGGTNLNYSFTGLLASTRYTFRVTGLATSLSGGTPVAMYNPATITFTTDPASVPGPISGLGVAVIPGGSATISWTAPKITGGSPITSISIALVDNTAGGSWSTIGYVDAGTVTVTVNGLVAGHSYNFRIWANNASGIGSIVTTGAVNAQ